MGRFKMGYHLREGARSIFTHGLMSFAAVCMIMGCLIIMGSFSLVAVTLDNTLGSYEAQNTFSAYIEETYTREQAEAVEAELLRVPNVSAVIFVTREEAKANYIQRYADAENKSLFSDLPDETLRDRYLIYVKDIEQMSSTVSAVKECPGVNKIRAELDLAEGFVTVRNVASAVAVILIALLLVISLFIIANTIKLATFHRREEISIMKMCGATNWFIRWPFIFEGMMLGLMGAAFAFFLQWGIYALMVQAVTQYGGLQLIAVVPFTELWGRMALTFAGAGLVIGAGGSLFAIRKFLQV